MKRKKTFYFPFLTFFILSSVIIVWQIIWSLAGVDLPVTFDVSLLQELHYVKEVETADQKEPLQRYGYHIVNSHKISSDRSIPDTRHANCHSLTSGLRHELPSASIIITYHLIERSVLLRNIVSILKRSKRGTVREIIVVDDGSSDAEDGQLLAQLPGVKVLRNEKSRGRGSARVQAAAVASGEVLVFVDSLAEVNSDWLSPLLLRLMESPKTLALPVLDSIDPTTFQYRPLPGLFRGGFDWSLQYHWEDIPLRYQAKPDPVSPFRSPAMCGSVFAVRKDFFNWLGKYDSSPGAHDTEDIELSLRAWLCGGQVEIIPCSRVGLIKVKGRELGVSPVSFNNYLRSARRMAEVWLDEFKRFFYAVRPSARMQPVSDIGSQRKLKERLRCRSFKWFLTSIYPQLQPLISDEVAYGNIKQEDNCVDLDPGQLPLVAKLRPCEAGKDSQEWSWRKRGVIVSNGMCLTSDLMNMQGYVVVQFCKEMETQIWYRHGDKIVHHDSNLCLDSHQGDLGLLITDCIKDNPTQSWSISTEKKKFDTGTDYIYSDDAQL